MGILRAVRSFISLYTIALSAKYFGVSIERDAWVIGGAIISVFSGFLFGPIVNIFRTKFVHLKEEEGELSALRSTSALLGGVFIVCLFIILITLLYPQVYVGIFAPGFDIEESGVLIIMIRWLIPSLLINQVVVIWTAILNSYNSFFIPDIFGFLSGLLNILFIIILSPYIQIYSLIVSSYFSSLIFSVLLIWMLKKRNIKLYRFHISWTDFKPYLLFALPLYFNYFAGQFLSVVERRLCTYLDAGTVSAFDYAKRFGDLTLNVILSIVPMVLTPILAGLFAKKLFKEFNKEFFLYVRMFMIGVIPIVICFTLCSGDIVQLLFNKGSIEAQFRDITTDTLFWMGVGISGVVLYVICGEALVAQKKVKTITVASSIAYVLIALIDVLFYKQFGAVLFAASWAIMHVLLGLMLAFFGSSMISKIRFAKEVMFIALFYFITFICAYGVSKCVHFDAANGGLIIFKVSVIGTSSCIVICLLIFIFKLEERIFLKKFFRSIV